MTEHEIIIILSGIIAGMLSRLILDYQNKKRRQKLDEKYRQKKEVVNKEHAERVIESLEESRDELEKIGADKLKRKMELLIGRVEETPGFASSEAFFMNYVMIMLMMIGQVCRESTISGLDNLSKN